MVTFTTHLSCDEYLRNGIILNLVCKIHKIEKKNWKTFFLISIHPKPSKNTNFCFYQNFQAGLHNCLHYCTKSLTDVWNNEVINNNCFSKKFKVADITPIFKKDDATMAKNYRPISVLPNVSKVFERIILSQLIPYIENYLSTYLCGYRKGFSTQYALISLI